MSVFPCAGKKMELQKILGERIEIAKDVNMSDEEQKKENEKSEIITRLAKQMINNVTEGDKLTGRN